MKATTWVLAGLLAISLVASTAAAEASLTIEELPEAASAPLQEGESVELPFSVTFEADGFGCVQGGEFEFAVSLTGSPPPGVNAAVTPETATTSVGPGLYMDPQDTYTGTFSGTLSVDAENVTSNATLPLSVQVNYDGNMPEGCQGNTPPARDASADTSVELIAPMPEPEPEVQVEDEKGIPAPGLFGVLLGVGAALAARRRR